MAAIFRTCCAPLTLCAEKNTKPLAMALATLVFLAGAATAGVALAGYIPYHYFYTGIGIITLELVLVGICLALSYCHHQKNSSHSIEAASSADEGRIGDTSPTVDSTTSDSESSEASDPDSETEVKIKEPGQKVAPLSKFWLPDEVWVRIFGYLDPQALSRAFLTCKSWNQLVQTDSVWSRWILEQDWHEDKPECFQVWRQIQSIKRATPRKIYHKKLIDEDDREPWAFQCSGNHWTFSTAAAVKVWNIQKGKLLQNSELKDVKFGIQDLAISNEVVYGLPWGGSSIFIWNLNTKQKEVWNTNTQFRDWNYIFADSEKLMTFCNGVLTSWDKKTFNQLNSQNANIRKFLVYKNQLIYVDPNLENVILKNLKSGREKTLVRNALWGTLFISGSVLIMQNQTGSPILRYDLDTKKWLEEMDTGQDFKLVGALGGMIIVHSFFSLELKIFDFRS